MKYLFVFSLVIFILSCSDQDSGTVVVSTSFLDSTMTIKNETNDAIYYIAIERNCTALIDWIPGFSGPKIDAGLTKKIPFSEIYNCNLGRDLQAHDEIIIYWWNADYFDTHDLKHKIIKL